MELLLIILTGFFLWLWIYDSSRRAFAQSRTEAGELIFSAAQKMYEIRYLSAVLYLFLFGMELWISGTDSDFEKSLLMTFFFWFILISIFPPLYFAVAYEIREKGLVARGLFAPWSEIGYCLCYTENKFFSWRNNAGRLQFCFHDFKKNFYVAPGRKEEAVVALRRFVEVRYEDGTVLPPLPESNVTPTDAGPPLPLRRTQFQFDLRSLLLFLVFASALSSLAGVHYHRWDRQQQALESLRVFKPKIDQLFSGVWEIDFSKSSRKPSDDDLSKLEQIPSLRRLNLSGAPITDAGLQHLEGLKNLHFLDLTGTRITKSGYQRLQKALPDARISWKPPDPPPPPLAPPAPG
ncbi:MAG: leucine-rich repeat domain-containing protein [Pirellulales bacterium]|nr:leucine-rich repeat domain-containing protein [Pirellulales bacterium]